MTKLKNDLAFGFCLHLNFEICHLAFILDMNDLPFYLLTDM